MRSLFSAIFAIALFFGLLSSADAQQQVLVGRFEGKIAFDTQKTPQFEVSGGVKSKKIPNPREWLEIEVEFDVPTKPREGVVPKLIFKYYVAIKSKEGPAKLVTGQVDHVNIVGDSKSYSCVYLSPATLGKITGDFRRFQPSDVIAIAVRMLHNGEIKGKADHGSLKDNWWEAEAGTPGVLSKADTPFALLWLDRYADVEESTN